MKSKRDRPIAEKLVKKMNRYVRAIVVEFSVIAFFDTRGPARTLLEEYLFCAVESPHASEAAAVDAVEETLARLAAMPRWIVSSTRLPVMQPWLLTSALACLHPLGNHSKAPSLVEPSLLPRR